MDSIDFWALREEMVEDPSVGGRKGLQIEIVRL